MPATAQTEQKLLNHYKLTTLYPDTWPHQDNESSDEDDEDVLGGNGHANRLAPNRHASKLSTNSRSSYSRFRNIDRHASIRSGTPTSESVVQSDEADPLGKVPSVAMEVKRRGLPVDENLRLRNRFMLSSTTFSPALFLAQVHEDASTEDLLRGLDHLSQSIEQKSASLKVLVESNFDKFVRAKATIDNVYKEMRDQGAESEQQQQPPSAGRRPHSRHTSRPQSHFRNTSGAFSPINKPLPSDKKKNALTKESEYGVQGIKAPLVEVAIKAEEVWGPALGGREKEEALKAAVSTIDSNKDVFRLSSSLHESIRKRDYDGVVEQYKQAKKFADQARNIAEIARGGDSRLGDREAQMLLVTAKMWHDVSTQIEVFKRDVWRRLKSSHGRKPAATNAVADEADREEHMELIGVLLQLGVDENPIWEWLHSRQVYLREKIARSFERSRIEIEIMRRKIANNPQTETKVLAEHLRSASMNSALRLPKDSTKDIDTPAVLAFWTKVQSALTSLLSPHAGGIVGELLEYWETAQSFIDNKAQKSFPTAVFAAGLEHLELEPDDVLNLRSGAVELVSIIRECVFSFFSDAPVEDLSDLYSPIPPTPMTPAPAAATGGDTPSGSTLTPSSKRAFSFDNATLPPPSPKKGDPWEKYAFWPPQANSLSGSHHLSRFLTLVGIAASDLASLSVIKQSRPTTESLKSLLGAVRERCVNSVTAAWTADAERMKYLENWQRSSDRRDLTLMPAAFTAWEERVVAGVQRIAYVSGVERRDVALVVVPPSAKLLQGVRQAFVASLYKALSGLVENAEKGVGYVAEDGAVLVVEKAKDGRSGEVDNTNTRKLLTLSNLTHLRNEILPQLLLNFESAFSVKLTDESKTIRDVLGQIDTRLFQSYVHPTTALLSKLISDGITSPQWPPTTARPTDAKPYIYDALLALVLVHSETISTAPLLTPQILSHHLEHASQSLLKAFESRDHYSLPALMQATLDVEFLAQTLNHFTTEKAGEIQSQIYLALDKRTDNDARAKLQGELPEMRGVLKRLREGTKGGFGCFRRERRGRERGGTGGEASRG